MFKFFKKNCTNHERIFIGVGKRQITIDFYDTYYIYFCEKCCKYIEEPLSTQPQPATVLTKIKMVEELVMENFEMKINNDNMKKFVKANETIIANL